MPFPQPGGPGIFVLVFGDRCIGERARDGMRKKETRSRSKKERLATKKKRATSSPFDRSSYSFFRTSRISFLAPPALLASSKPRGESSLCSRVGKKKQARSTGESGRAEKEREKKMHQPSVSLRSILLTDKNQPLLRLGRTLEPPRHLGHQVDRRDLGELLGGHGEREKERGEKER